MGTIICAVDGTGNSDQTLATAAELAALTDSTLLVAHVQQADPRGLDAAALQEMQRSAEHVAAGALADAVIEANATVVGLVGAPGAKLAELAELHDGAVIVLGSRSRGRAGTTFRSRIMRELATHTRVPVLIAPARPAVAVPDGVIPTEPVEAPVTRTRPRRRTVRAWSETSPSIRRRPFSG